MSSLRCYHCQKCPAWTLVYPIYMIMYKKATACSVVSATAPKVRSGQVQYKQASHSVSNLWSTFQYSRTSSQISKLCWWCHYKNIWHKKKQYQVGNQIIFSAFTKNISSYHYLSLAFSKYQDLNRYQLRI